MKVHLALILAVGLAFGVRDSVRGEEYRPREYGGRSLAEWGERIKSVPLDSLGNSADVQGLKAVVRDVEAPWPDRRQAALTLGRIGRPAESAVPLLLDLLNGEGVRDSRTRIWVLKAFAYYGPVADSVTADVARIAADTRESHLVRMAAMEALALVGKFRREAIATLTGVLTESQGESQAELETRLVAVDALWYLGPGAAPALPELLALSRSGWSPLRLGVAQTLGEIGPAAEIAIPVLVDTVLFDSAGEVREAAVDALAKQGGAGLDALSRLLQDTESEVRRLAVRGLKKHSGPQAVAVLEAALGDEDPLVAVEAAAAAAGLDRKGTVSLDALLVGLVHSDRHVRLTAYRALGQAIPRLGPYVEELQRIADSPDFPEQSRTAAARLIAQTTEATSPP